MVEKREKANYETVNNKKVVKKGSSIGRAITSLMLIILF